MIEIIEKSIDKLYEQRDTILREFKNIDGSHINYHIIKSDIDMQIVKIDGNIEKHLDRLERNSKMVSLDATPKTPLKIKKDDEV